MNQLQTAMLFVNVCCRLRGACQNIAGTKQFDFAVLFFIALNCITLAMERPDIPSHSLARSFSPLDIPAVAITLIIVLY